jgi:hypothetical protein
LLHREAGEHALIELCALRDDELLRDWVIEGPRVVVGRIADKDALLHVRLELLALVLLYEDIGRAPKHSEATEIRLLAKPRLKWSLPGQ